MDVIEIPQTKGLVARVSAEDALEINAHKWSAHESKLGVFYACRRMRLSEPSPGAPVFMHRVIVVAPKGLLVDHIDGDGLNNVRSNLRVATQTQNHANGLMNRGGTSRFKGVSWRRDKSKWNARIGCKGRVINLGLFGDEVSAALAYDRAATEMFGDFAKVNFPDKAVSK